MAAIREILARNIKENRRKLGITQSELAELADISTNFVAMIELQRKFPAPETLDRLAAALNIETPELFFTPASAEAALRRLHEAILGDVERAISEGVKMALTRGFSGHLKK